MARRATSSSTTTRTTAPPTSPTSRSSSRSSSGASSSASRSTTAHHLDLGALTPGHVRHRRRGGRVRRGPAAQRGQGRGGGAGATSSAWRIIADNYAPAPARRRRHGGAGRGGASSGPTATLELIGAFGLETVRAAVRAAHGPLRADAAPRDRRSCRTAVTRPRAPRRLPRPSRPGATTNLRDQGRRDGQRLATCTSTWTAPRRQVDLPINMPLVGTVDIAICVTLRSILLDSDTPRRRSRRTRGCSGRSRSSRPRARSPTRAFPAPTIARFCPRQHHRRHGHAGARAGAARGRGAGVGNLKVVAYSGAARRRRLGLHGHRGGQLRRPLRQGRPRRGRHPLREHAQQPDRGHRVALPAARPPLRAAEDGGGAGPLARRPGLDPRDRVPRRRRRARSRATATRPRPPGLFGGGEGSPAR